MHGSYRHESSLQQFLSRCCIFCWVLQYLLLTVAAGLGTGYATDLKKETEELFYHGYENYMRYAFPEDELRPVSCKPLTRDPDNPAHIEVNDALGNYSLTLIDSLSTLAILASSPTNLTQNKPLRLFQDGVRDLVEQYGDGTRGSAGLGLRARGFAVDSKVQVFETVIRGLGGLLSAHLFAVGDLPIRGYEPALAQALYAREWSKKKKQSAARSGIVWDNGFVYDGQLLRLAYDLGKRLIPAFWTPTGIPYPRVNLRDGIPFYANSPFNQNPIDGQCTTENSGPVEVTETCAAGAGSLVLEFTVLSRLTGDPRFEELGKRAFWAIWSRRSEINLLGAGIDAETGQWIQSYSGIGAGTDSFFEYAFKSFILLSNEHHPLYSREEYVQDPRMLFEPLTDSEHSPSTFLDAWEVSHTANKRHLLRVSNFQHPHYIVGDLSTGAARAFWVDALSAFYPGLLTISGYVEEAVETHLLATALWTRFSALPERYNLITGDIEGGLGWWVGRPEFIESNYYLYRATEDPWYLYVAEMTLRDIKRRCWAKCGWSGIQNVLTGEMSDRMESFFLGETAKYLFLTFDEDHPLNKIDTPFVFSTEGHPLIIPPTVGAYPPPWELPRTTSIKGVCPARQPDLPLSVSNTAARGDVYHAGSLARLHLMPKREDVDSPLGEYALDHPSITIPDLISPSNYTYFPWTLPPELVPFNAISTILPTRPTFDISFPTMSNAGQAAPLQRVKEGILINFLGGLRLGLVQDVPFWADDNLYDGYRIHAINNVGLGKDEKIFLARDTGMGTLNPADPEFTRVRDTSYIDIVVETVPAEDYQHVVNETLADLDDSTNSDAGRQTHRSVKAAWKSLMSQLTGLVQDSQHLPFTLTSHLVDTSANPRVGRISIPAVIPSGVGAAPIPDWTEAPSQITADSLETPLAWRTIYAEGDLCDEQLPQSVVRHHQILVIKRGNCSFSQKMSNIPLFTPSPTSLQLVIIVNYDVKGDDSMQELLFRPLLDEAQVTRSGLRKQYPLPMVMVAGGAETYEALSNARAVGMKRRYSIRSQGIPITNLIIV